MSKKINYNVKIVIKQNMAKIYLIMKIKYFANIVLSQSFMKAILNANI